MEKYILNRRGDLSGNTVIRVCRHQLLARLLPMGNYRGGAGLRCLLVLTVLHYLGRPLFQVLIRCERQLAGLYRLQERLRHRGEDEDE